MKLRLSSGEPSYRWRNSSRGIRQKRSNSVGKTDMLKGAGVGCPARCLTPPQRTVPNSA